MKNLRKLLAVVVVVAMMATFMIPAFAQEAELSDVEICEKLGMLKGTGDGVTVEYLTSPTERNQAAIMFLRLQGLEDEALAYDGEDNFDDADELWSGGQAILAYLKANPDLGWQGVGDNKFEPRATIDAKSYYKVMLEALGYKQEVDFLWSNVLEFAAEKGLSAIAPVEEVTNAEIAAATVEALKATVKDSEQTLIEKLVADGIVSQEAAVEVGLISGELTASVAVTGAKKLTVTFNNAVDDTKAAFTVKKGGISVNVSSKTFADDKKSVVLELAGKITAGDYTVVVSGLTDTALEATVTAVDEKVAEITISENAVFVDSSTAHAYYTALNQYGEDITATVTLTAASSASTVNLTPSSGLIAFSYVAPSTVKVGDKVSITIVDTNSATSASKVLTVSDKSGVSEMEVTLYNADGETLTADSTVTDFKLVIDAKDQYGNKMDAAALNADLLVTVSDTTVVSVNGYNASTSTATFTTTKIDGADKATLPLAGAGALKAGTTKVTFISKNTGKVSHFDIVVKDGVVVDTISLIAPSVVAVGENAVIQIDARDKDGNAVNKVSEFANTNVNVTSTAGTSNGVTGGFKMNPSTGKVELVIPSAFLGTAKGRATVFVTTETLKIVQIQLDVKDKAVPTTFVGFKSTSKVVPNLYNNEAVTFGLNDIIVEDQYGRVMSSSSLTALLGTKTDADAVGPNNNKDKFVIVFTSSNNAIISDGDTATKAANISALSDDSGILSFDSATVILTAGATKGSAIIACRILKGDSATGNYAVVAGSGYDYAMRVVDKKQVTSYEVKDLGMIYDDGVAGYTKDVTVYGILPNGTKVVIPAANYTVASSHAGLSVAGNTLDANGVVGADLKDVTVDLTIIVDADGATEVLTTQIVVSKATPRAVELKIASAGGLTVDGTGVTGAVADVTIAKLKALVTTVDQYGTENAPGAGGPNDPVMTFTNIRLSAGSTFTVTNNGTTGAAITIPPSTGDMFDLTMTYGTQVVTFKVAVQ
jgi:hypothetical protein